jgi:uncharacterized protein DUF1326
MKPNRILPRTLPVLSVLAILSVLSTPLCLAAPTISGDYLEARTADIYTGPCFANAEVNLTGKEAIFAWRVREGVWRGVSVEGLSVVAVVRTAATLGEPTPSPLQARSVLLVDERADAAQKDALVGFAREMAGDLLADIVAVESAPIQLDVESGSTTGHVHADASGLSGAASLQAGNLVELKTRGLNHGDHLCGNEEVYYPPLTATSEAVPAVTLTNAFRGNELGKTWSSPGKRSAFVGRFER